MAGEYRLARTATLDALEPLHELFAGVDEPVGSMDLMLFETAVIEVVGNLIQHGRPPGEVRFDFTLQVTDTSLLGRIDETGETVAFNLDHPMPDASEESGRGLPLIRAVLDEFTFERAGGHNVWQLRRDRQH